MRICINSSLDQPPVKLDLTRHWYRRGPVAFLLLPLAGLYCLLSRFQRYRLEKKQIRAARSVPVIVVGNISVGGTGKTPMVIWLAEFLFAQGFNPGIVSRGYGGIPQSVPKRVTAKTDARTAGDETVVIARRTSAPVWVFSDRTAAVSACLKEHADIDIIISDDGLQHYRLYRDIEICMIDGSRRFGNGLCLPSGPLRETVQRLKQVDFQVVTAAQTHDLDEYSLQIEGNEVINMHSPSQRYPLTKFQNRKIHAVAGLGNPERFFSQLEQAGMEVMRHPFSDHHHFTLEDLSFPDDAPIIMTEKDAVKCGIFVDQRFWYLPIRAMPDPVLGRAILQRLQEINRGQETAGNTGLPGHQRPADL
ncbi:MAG TPA: tetraacyldisaccharide 4'-kinase [Gammaproteobacteria bacterium]|nr:tetraacyldisaccharide 4'-kinase [Gammaproteobacteria bacterium]